jgi:hypothetical protein
MSDHKKTTTSYRREVLKTNAKVDVRIIKNHRLLERNLKKLGVEIKPTFGLEPPLGGGHIHLHNEDR